MFDNFVGLAVKRLKEDSGAAFFCEFCEIFKNNYFFEHVRTAASNLSSSVFGKFLSYRNTVSSSISMFIHVKMILQFSATSGAHL